MKLDFLTLYLVILLNSLIYCVVWAGFCYVHRGIPGARYWLGSSLMTTLGGLLMSGDGSAYGRLLMVAGNVFVVWGFFFVWTGIRVFYGAEPNRRAGGFMLAVTVLAGILADESRASQNIAYAVPQLVPLGFSLVTLIRKGGGGLGALVAAAGVLVAMAGQGTETILNTLRLMGDLSTDGYYSVAAFLLVAAIFGAGLWNIGFLLMAIDHLHGRLAGLALLDDLTGLPNRRAFFEAAEAGLRQAQRARRPLSLLMIDVDNFKEINDRLGHGAGDACLRHFSMLCAGSEGNRVVARMGGDEFATLLVGADAVAARASAERLVQLVARTPLLWLGESIPMTVSIGIAVTDAAPACTLERLIDEADQALYETKRQGRNGFSLGGGFRSGEVTAS